MPVWWWRCGGDDDGENVVQLTRDSWEYKRLLFMYYGSFNCGHQINQEVKDELVQLKCWRFISHNTGFYLVLSSGLRSVLSAALCWSESELVI